MHYSRDATPAEGAAPPALHLVVDPGDYSVTHVLLQEGHLRWKKRVAIPTINPI